MGVHSFWEVVGPTARPVRLESLQDRKMAVDASIWIYQFLKAVRDREGSALKYSHIVGFFRRICKLLYFGIKPVFVFDGGVPALKQDTIRQRKERRQGKRDDAVLTAKKLLAIQLHRQQDSSRRQLSPKRVEMQDDESAKVELFRPHDEWDLPKIPGFRYELDDQRVSTANNYEKLVNSMDDELDGIDLDSINPNSPEFDELPKSAQYMIISKLRLRSRWRMGYTKEQLEQLFPNSMDFSKFQIDMVRRRNFFTQKLMNVTGIHDGGASRLDQEVVNRISGQLHKEYKLTKTDRGWALGLGEFDGSESDRAISLDDKDVETLKSFGHEVTTISKPTNPKLASSADHHVQQDEHDIEWEDVDTECQDNKFIEDFSLKAARLPQLDKEPSTAGGKSFLDTRPSQISPVKKAHVPRDVIEIHEENIDSLKDGIEDRESFQKPMLEERLGRSSCESYKVRDRETNVYDEDEVDNYLERVEELESVETMQMSEMKRCFKREAKDHKELRKCDFRGKPVKDDVTPLLIRNPALQRKQSSLSPSRSACLENRVLENRLPTDSEQNLNFIISKIPDFDLSKRNSFLFQETNNKVKDSELRVGDKTKNASVDMPSWFQHGNGQNPNPFASSNFVSDREIKISSSPIVNDNATEILQRVTGLEEGGELENFKEPETDGEIYDTTEARKVDAESTDRVEQADGSSLDDKQIETDFGASRRMPLVFDYDFSEDDEENIVENIRKEEQEFRTFKNILNNRVIDRTFVEDELYQRQTKDKRDSDEVTADMIMDVQELLSRFGVPYITAPMEAEAQCAALMRDHLVEGIITDDSDVFLFGGNKVYKNMFSERNYVEYYDSESIYRSLGLDRCGMIELAQLLGSDYTNGIKGMGPVSSMEVLAEFGSLKEFRDWYNSGQFDTKKQEQEGKFEKDLRKRMVKNEVVLDDGFPSQVVKNAYLNPEVDNDGTQFIWGTPDLDMLRSFFESKVGWSQEKTDEVLVPLIRDMNKRKKNRQSTIADFFPRGYIQSQRNLNLGKRLTVASGKLKRRKLR